jgi:hypothetical protein
VLDEETVVRLSAAAMTCCIAEGVEVDAFEVVEKVAAQAHVVGRCGLLVAL